MIMSASRAARLVRTSPVVRDALVARDAPTVWFAARA